MPDADNTYIRRDMTRVSPELVSQAAEFQAPIPADMAGRRGTLHGRVKPLSATMKVAAPALTLDVRPGDSHAALAIAQPGEDDCEGEWDKSIHTSFVKMGTAAASNVSKVLAEPLKKEGALP